jgi:O-antigen ligase
MHLSKPSIKENIGVLGLLFYFAGLIYSPFLLSLSYVFLLIQVFFSDSFSQWKHKLKSNVLAIAFLIFFCWILIGGLYSESVSAFLKDLQIKLPFLILPLVMGVSFYKRKNTQLFLHFTFIVVVFSAGLISFINYLWHYREINQLIFQAKPVPILANINHIYYSIVLSFAIFSGLYVFVRKELTERWRWLNSLMLILNLVFLHTIAARTGLFAFYASVFVFILYNGIRSKKFGITALACLLLFSAVFVSVRYVPVLNNRYQKSLEDINAYRTGSDINHYSISMRLEYWEKSLKVFTKSPIIGVGLADVKLEMKRLFEKENSILIPENRKGPHNQYLEVLAGMGIIGFAMLIFILTYMLFLAIKQRNDLLLLFLTIFLFSFLVESALERQSGISFFVLFALFLKNGDFQSIWNTSQR